MRSVVEIQVLVYGVDVAGCAPACMHTSRATYNSPDIVDASAQPGGRQFEGAIRRERSMRMLSVAVAVVTLLLAGCSGGETGTPTTTSTTNSSAVRSTSTTAPTRVTSQQAPSASNAPGVIVPASPSPGAPPPNTDFGGTCEGQEHCSTVPAAPENPTDFGGTCEGQEHCPTVPAPPPAAPPQHPTDFGGTCEGQEHCPAG